MCWQTARWDHRREVLLDYKRFNAAVTAHILFSVIQISQWTCISADQQDHSAACQRAAADNQQQEIRNKTALSELAAWWCHQPARISPEGIPGLPETQIWAHILQDYRQVVKHIFFSRSISLFLLEAFGTKKLMWGDTEWCADILCRIHVTTTNLWTLPTSVTFLLISLILSFFKYLIWKTLRQHVYVWKH